jgi:hypothetical protein
VAPLEYEQAQRIETAIEKARDVIRFSASQTSFR